MTTTIEVTIENIRVDLWYFSFDYSMVVDGEEVLNGEYDGDHAYQDDPYIYKELLENGEAVKLVLGEYCV